MPKKLVILAMAAVMLSGCSNLTRQQQRALSGGAIGAAGGAAIAAMAGGPVVAGALIGAGAGAVVGAVTH
ncbi:MAG: osmotically inducible lipoprotein OsmB [Aliidongia sp.]|nr:osmotically inducible lipoprotein OsmB [Aliidongia sp.]